MSVNDTGFVGYTNIVLGIVHCSLYNIALLIHKVSGVSASSDSEQKAIKYLSVQYQSPEAGESNLMSTENSFKKR
jgi:hypothetical protein